MACRMDKYNDSLSENQTSRLSKNKSLYENLSTNTSYIEFTEVEIPSVIELNSKPEKPTKREAYQMSKRASFLGENKKTFSNSNINLEEIETTEQKTYDINEVLEKARMNRMDSKESYVKRKLKSTEYDILTDLSEERLKDYQTRKKEVLGKDEEEKLEELIHTITSNKIRQEINNELLGDLMPSKLDETIISEGMNEEINEIYNTDELKEALEKTYEEEIDTTDIRKLDESFYTKSMDLSDEDLIKNLSINDDSFEELQKSPSKFRTVVIISIILIVLLLISFIIYKVIK